MDVGYRRRRVASTDVVRSTDASTTYIIGMFIGWSYKQAKAGHAPAGKLKKLMCNGAREGDIILK